MLMVKLLTIVFVVFSDLELHSEALQLAKERDMELRASKFPCAKEQTRAPRLVRVGLVQHRMPRPAHEPIEQQRQAAHHRVEQMLEVAALAKVNVVCLEEIWSKLMIIFRQKVPEYTTCALRH